MELLTEKILSLYNFSLNHMFSNSINEEEYGKDIKGEIN